MTVYSTDTIGCDLGDVTSSLFVVKADGSTERPKSLRTTRKAFVDFFSKRTPSHVVIETGTHSRWVSQELEKLGHNVTIANPRRVKLISANNQKNDEADSELLARLGRADVELLSPIRHRGEDAQAELAVIKARDSLVRSRTKLVNEIRGLVKSFGERLPGCDAAGFHRRTWEFVPKKLQLAVGPLYETLKTLETEIKNYDKIIEQLAKKHPDVEIVSQPHGVGVLTALAFILTLEDKGRFKKSRMVAPFIGLVPRRNQSGEIDKQLSITKAGDPLLRRLLVGSANFILGPFGPDCDLRRFGERLCRRGGKNAKKRARVAVARKLSVLLHRLWVTGEVYDPLRNSKAIEAKAA